MLRVFFSGEHDCYCDEKVSHQSNICFAGGITDVDLTKRPFLMLKKLAPSQLDSKFFILVENNILTEIRIISKKSSHFERNIAQLKQRDLK